MEFYNRDISHLSYLSRVMDEGLRVKKNGLQACYTSQAYAFHGMAEFLSVRYPASLEENDQKESAALFDAMSKWVVDSMKSFKSFNKSAQIIRSYKKLGSKSRKQADDYFRRNVRDILQPISVDWARVPDIHSGLYVLTITKRGDEAIYGYIEIPGKISRFVRLGSKKFVVPVEDIVIGNIESILAGVKCVAACPFRVIRSSEVYTQKDLSGDPYDQVKETLKERRRSWVTAIELATTNDDCIKAAADMVRTGPDTIKFCVPMVRLEDLSTIPAGVFDPDDLQKKLKPVSTLPSKSMFEIIRSEGPLLLCHPYESYDASFVRFLKEAASDKSVIGIRITLYRVSNDSDIVKALVKAAASGKQVVVLMELKARFDEQHNMDVSQVLLNSGCNVAYTDVDIKTHAKVCLVTRCEKKRLRVYCHVGTGNYSQTNSRSYVDYSYFSDDRQLTEELVKFFALLTSKQEPFKSKRIIYAPYNLKSTIVDLIDEQIKIAKKGGDGQIIAKCNAITDEGVAKKLCEAASAGVKVRLIVRSASIIPPKKNITEDSIVGRFLEHSRIYCFGSDKDAKIYLGSSDLMTRNLSRRNELLIQITEKAIRKRLMKHLGWYLDDNVNRRRIKPDYEYELVKCGKGDKAIDAQELMKKEAKGLKA